MIYGVGTDILDVERIACLYQRYGFALARRILTVAEQIEFQKSPHPVRFLAKRFAAKEAFAKAVGTGIRPPVSFRHIAVEHDDLGKPLFYCEPQLQQWLYERQIACVHLSISDEKQQVLAFAIAEKKPFKLPEDNDACPVKMC